MTKSLATFGLMSVALVTLQAGNVLYDFNTLPPESGIFIYALVNGGPPPYLPTDPQWVPDHGAGYDTNSLDGFLQITGAYENTKAVVIFRHVDNGAIIRGLSLNALLRIGGGTDPPGAGLSLNFARADDPVVLAPLKGAFASGPNGEANLPEEGTQTGLAIELDDHDGGDGGGGVKDIAGVGVRLDNKLLVQVPLPDLNGACENTNALQTGPLDPANPGSYDLLCWQPISIVLDANGLLNLSYKSRVILTNYQIHFEPSAGYWVLAGHTTGMWQNQDIDNLHMMTLPFTVPEVYAIDGTACGFRVDVGGSSRSTPDTNSIALKLNGAPVTPTSIITETNRATHVAYFDPHACSPPGTTNTVEISFIATTGQKIDETRTYVVPSYTVVPDDVAAPAGLVDTNKPGFNLRTVQADTTTLLTDSVARAEAQLAGTLKDPSTGQPYPDVSVPGINTDNSYTVPDVINFNCTGFNEGGPSDAGDFQLPLYPDQQFPGIDPQNPKVTSGSTTGNFAVRTLTFLDLESAPYRMIVNSDDGFTVSVGTNAQDTLQPLGAADYEKASSDVAFDFVITNSGYYPFRLVYFQGGGAASLEWTLIDLNTGEKILINDPDNPDSVKAYLSRTMPPPGPPHINVTRTDGKLTLDWIRSGFILQSSISLGNPSWSDMRNADTPPIRVLIEDGYRYFRLRKE